jgi:hypothetical protein
MEKGTSNICKRDIQSVKLKLLAVEFVFFIQKMNVSSNKEKKERKKKTEETGMSMLSFCRNAVLH